LVTLTRGLRSWWCLIKGVLLAKKKGYKIVHDGFHVHTYSINQLVAHSVAKHNWRLRQGCYIWIGKGRKDRRPEEWKGPEVIPRRGLGTPTNLAQRT
jgi:hypothetical protein